MTHDYKRNGTTTLFASLDVLSGNVIGQCQPRHRHRHGEFLKFLRVIDRQVPSGLKIHMICDNYGTHKHADVQGMAGKAPALPPAPRRRVPGSTWSVVPQPHRSGDPPRRLPLGPRADRRDRGLPRGEQRRPQAVHLDCTPPTGPVSSLAGLALSRLDAIAFTW